MFFHIHVFKRVKYHSGKIISKLLDVEHA